MSRYVLCPGLVVSKSDGDVHFISGPQLAKLYGVRARDCVYITNGTHPREGDVFLRPRSDGNYDLALCRVHHEEGAAKMSMTFRHKVSGGYVEVEDVEISFAPQGGGFVRRGKLSQFLSDFEFLPGGIPSEFKFGYVTIDDVYPNYPAMISNRRWNGWAMPYFDFETALKVAEDTTKYRESNPDGCGYFITYDAEKDSFWFKSTDPEDEGYSIGPTEICGKKYYPLGAGDWIWIEAPVSDENPE